MSYASSYLAQLRSYDVLNALNQSNRASGKMFAQQYPPQNIIPMRQRMSPYDFGHGRTVHMTPEEFNRLEKKEIPQRILRYLQETDSEYVDVRIFRFKVCKQYVGCNMQYKFIVKG